jgi:alanyl-tRNA synthetase
VLRIVSIGDLDRSACGGTHVRSTAEIGPVMVRKLDKIRGNVRIEFLCGDRAIRRARADYEALSAVARVFSSPVDDAPGLVKFQSERLQDLEKAHKKAAGELAQYQGRDLYSATEPDANGIRRAVLRDAITDDLRARAQAFVSQPKALLIVISEKPPSLLVVASKDSGVHAGNLVKNLVTAHGGRGGGSPVMGQGSVPDADALQRVVSALL